MSGSRFAALLLSLLLCAGARAAEVAELPAGLSFAVAPPVSVVSAVSLPADVGLSGVRWQYNYASAPDGQPLPSLGRGEFGAAFLHPLDPSQMLKVAADGFGGIIARTRADRDADTLEEAEATRLLADAQAGPRLIAVTRIPYHLQPLLNKVAGWFGATAPDLSRPTLIKETVVGDTVGQLKRDRCFTPEHAALVLQMKRRIAAAGLSATDLHDENIMIGTTASAPEPRAHLVDAGHVRASR